MDNRNEERAELEHMLAACLAEKKDMATEYMKTVERLRGKTAAKIALHHGDKFLRKADPVGATKEYAIIETSISSNQFDPTKVRERIVGVFKTMEERDRHLTALIDHRNGIEHAAGDLPWRVSEKGADAVDDAVIVDKNGREVLGVSEWARVEDEHLAQIIVAVNKHDSLKGALEEARKWIYGQPDRSTCKAQTLNEMIAVIDAALEEGEVA